MSSCWNYGGKTWCFIHCCLCDRSQTSHDGGKFTNEGYGEWLIG